MYSPDRSFSDVLHDIVANFQGIIRSEVTLAKTEIREELKKVQSAGVWLGIGALASILAVIFLLLAAMFALTRLVPDWAAALVVTLIVAIIAAAAFMRGRNRIKEAGRVMPETIHSWKENVRWAKQQVK